jgi:hypothetical protein
MYAITIRPSLPPLSNIRISLCPSPYSRTMFEAVHPLSFVDLSVFPLIPPAAVRFALDVVSFIDGTVGKFLVALTLFLIVLPVSFVDAVVSIKHDAFAVSLGIDYVSEVYGLLELFELGLGVGKKRVHLNVFGDGVVLGDEVGKFFDLMQGRGMEFVGFGGGIFGGYIFRRRSLFRSVFSGYPHYWVVLLWELILFSFD